MSRPRDACALSETAAGFAASLNQKVGQRDGPREPVSSVRELASVGPIIESRSQFDACRATLVFVNGQTQSGTISVLDRTAGTITQSSWQSDEALQKIEAEQRARNAEADRRAREQRIADRAIPIEKDALLFDSAPGSIVLIEKLVLFVRESGFSCASVSGARPALMSRGYVVTCNKFSYTYDIQDKGGNWMVTVR